MDACWSVAVRHATKALTGSAKRTPVVIRALCTVVVHFGAHRGDQVMNG